MTAFEAAGVDLLLLQCSPQFEEMERFAAQVIQPSRGVSTDQPIERLPLFPPGLAEGLASW